MIMIWDKLERGREEHTSPSTCKKLEARDSLEIDIFLIDVGRAWLRMFDALLQPCPATPCHACLEMQMIPPRGCRSCVRPGFACNAQTCRPVLPCSTQEKLDCLRERASPSR